MQNDTAKVALVLGITGSFGREVACALGGRGWKIRAVHREPASGRPSFPEGADVDWIRGDVMRPEDVIGAARGASLIVHAVNPPRYRNWRGLALPMLDNTIAAALASRARVVLSAPIYNFGPDAGTLLREDSPQRPLTRKGRIRVEMEERLQQAVGRGVRSLVVRSGDYFGPGARSSWLTQGLARANGSALSVSYPKPWDVGHSWAYLPDLADATVQLIEQDRQLGDFEVFHFRGHWLERGVALAETVCRLHGLDAGRIKAFPWWAVRLMAPFNETFREMLEMRYLWQVPLQLDNTKLRARLGREPQTPLDAALKATLAL